MERRSARSARRGPRTTRSRTSSAPRCTASLLQERQCRDRTGAARGCRARTGHGPQAPARSRPRCARPRAAVQVGAARRPEHAQAGEVPGPTQDAGTQRAGAPAIAAARRPLLDRGAEKVRRRAAPQMPQARMRDAFCRQRSTAYARSGDAVVGRVEAQRVTREPDVTTTVRVATSSASWRPRGRRGGRPAARVRRRARACRRRRARRGRSRRRRSSAPAVRGGAADRARSWSGGSRRSRWSHPARHERVDGSHRIVVPARSPPSRTAGSSMADRPACPGR